MATKIKEADVTCLDCSVGYHENCRRKNGESCGCAGVCVED